MIALLGALALAAASIPPPSGDRQPLPDERSARGGWLEKFPGPQEGFLLRLQALCTGERYAGRVVSGGPEDEARRREGLVLGPSRCETAGGRLTEIALPVAGGGEVERRWVVSRTASGLRLRHRREGATVSGYGGVAEGGGTFTRQAFPADAESRALFEREGLQEATEDLWVIEVVPGDRLAYELVRPGRRFRAEFDLSRPLPD